MLSLPARLAAVMKLAEAPGPVRLAEIRAEISPGVAKTTFCQTLKPLVTSGLVARFRRDGEAYYGLAPGARERLGPLLELVESIPE